MNKSDKTNMNVYFYLFIYSYLQVSTLNRRQEKRFHEKQFSWKYLFCIKMFFRELFYGKDF